MTIQSLKAGESQALDSSSLEEVGIGGFTLFARVSDSTAYTTASPTSVVEDGNYAGDMLINSPIVINISGDVADIFIAEAPKSQAESRLPTVGKMTGYLPGRTPSQTQEVAKIIDNADDKRREINERILLGQNSGDFAGNKSAGKSIREQFIDFIETVHYGKQLISISMPFRKHDSMAVNSLTIVRDNQRKALSFTLTAQKFRINKTIYSNVSQFYKKPAPSVKSQVGGTADKGVQSPTSGEKKEKSLLSAVLGR